MSESHSTSNEDTSETPLSRSTDHAQTGPAGSGGAGSWLRFAAIAAYLVFLALWFAAPSRLDELRAEPNSAALLGTILGHALGAFLVPTIVVGIASIWRSNRSERRRVMIFTASLFTLASMEGYFIVRAQRGIGSGAPWRYHAPDRTFSLTLPSASWKPSREQTHVADFWFPDMAPMLASVLSVTEQSLEDYQARMAAVRESSNTSGGSLRMEFTQTVKGDPCLVQHTMTSRGGMRGNVYDAQCLCRLTKAGLAVALLLERQGRMLSDSGRAVERREFESQVNAICASVQPCAAPP